ncbi:glycosyltransferase family 2 protein [Amycolatopsis alkalitolerans]|uniref:Glycosyltransferase family 2 protein n=1 Tax=Amycolatopsis alkalitolerans TaxID=2547244 RepID=A0A5C4M8Y6_9PSEU|nr:glycosyltransferase family 2 protein [Amycolatopsis alkalitolerans]TNC28172.1 glycosyltransferase family 2 protein [Amycolatopsis alkalitolerans]
MTASLRRHWLITVLLVAGLVLRVLVWLAYQPALLYIDSFRYLENLTAMRPDQLNPIGYDLILRPLLAVGDLAFVAAVQHVLGLALGVALYALARRLGARAWVAALVAVPVLLDGYQLQIEQNIMAEVWFDALLVAVLWLLLARGVPGWRSAGVAGLLVGFAVLVRLIGITLVVPFAVYLLLAGGLRVGWRRIAARTTAGLVGCALVVGGYAAYFASVTGSWGVSTSSGNVLYGRAAVVADCGELKLDDTLRALCPAEPLGQRQGVDYYAHLDTVPGWPPVPVPPGETSQQLMHEFGMAVVRAQPWDFAREVLGDFAKGFAWSKTTSPNDVPVERWQFQTTYPTFDFTDASSVTRPLDGVDPSVDPALAGFLRGYQLSVGYTPGPLLAAAGLLGLAGLARRRGRLRGAALLTTGSALVLLGGAAVFEFSWRYQLPGLVLLPLAGAIGFTALTRYPKLDPFPDAVDSASLAAFHQRYGTPRLAEVTVVIAAYNEENGLGPVLDAMPRTSHGMDVDVLVVVDGATDATAAVAEHGAYVCAAPRNRGQGAALRLGYQLASELGARYVVTTDADGQYDNSELPTLLAPLLEGTADFVTGSRRLGHEDADSRLRWLGVRVFALLASILTRRHLTDTSFGFRAMHADLARDVTLAEPQYQSSELLLGVLARGARVVELPMTMRLRKAGKSKKGRNVAYGANYARVMLSTWWRDHIRKTTRSSSANFTAKITT